MAMTLGRVVSAVLGGILVQVATWGVQQSSAAWGWTLSVPSGSEFTCDEGATIGCGSMPPACGEDSGCCTENYTCTVVANSGYTCDLESIAVQCKLDSETTWKQPTSTVASGGSAAVTGQATCINNGMAGHAKNAALGGAPTSLAQRRLAAVGVPAQHRRGGPAQFRLSALRSARGHELSSARSSRPRSPSAHGSDQGQVKGTRAAPGRQCSRGQSDECSRERYWHKIVSFQIFPRVIFGRFRSPGAALACTPAIFLHYLPLLLMLSRSRVFSNPGAGADQA